MQNNQEKSLNYLIVLNLCIVVVGILDFQVHNRVGSAVHLCS